MDYIENPFSVNTCIHHEEGGLMQIPLLNWYKLWLIVDIFSSKGVVYVVKASGELFQFI